MAQTSRSSPPRQETSSDPLEDPECSADKYEPTEKEAIFTLGEDRKKTW